MGVVKGLKYLLLADGRVFDVFRKRLLLGLWGLRLLLLTLPGTGRGTGYGLGGLLGLLFGELGGLFSLLPFLLYYKPNIIVRYLHDPI